MPLQLLAAAEEESSRHAEEAALMRRSVDTLAGLRAAAEARLAEEYRQRVAQELGPALPDKLEEELSGRLGELRDQDFQQVGCTRG